MKATKDQEDMLYSEEFFQEILSLERKRTDRYNRPFILVLINFSNIDVEDERNNLIRIISGLLNQITRETDVKGWYEQDSVLGILFTEIDDEKTDVINQLKKRFSENMRESTRSGKWDAIDISYQGYPTDVQYIEENGENLVFYPQVVQDREESKVGPFIKRFMDISISLVTLVFFLPLFLVISIAIKMSSPGSVFFRQERLGLYGKKFSMLKFRTMTVNNDHEIHRDFVNNLINGHHEEGKPLKITNDSRVTKVGWFLRKSSLDELPQLINVLKGEMSLVGPRPPIDYEFEAYKLWHRQRVIQTKPGITGLWQVEGRSACVFDEMVRLDLKYIQNWSILLDVMILFKTIGVVLRGKGAY